jgi:hypothetical protein
VRIAIAALVAGLLFCGTADAYFAPTLTSVSVRAPLHPFATFSASSADDAIIVIATQPDRATDGSFFQENIKQADVLTDSEIQAGQWLDEEQLDPGVYYVILGALCFHLDDTNCANGYSNVLTLKVSFPTVRYATRITTVYRGISVYAQIRASTLGVDKPYRICYVLRSGAQRCRSETITGFSWGSTASDEVRLPVTRAMATTTTVTWRVDGRLVGRKKVRVR